MNQHRPSLTAFAAVLVAASLSGCVNLDPQPDPTRYYTIDPAGPATESAASPTGNVLVVVVTTAGYLEQPSIVERQGGHEIAPLPLHRWAEPLAQALPRAIARRLQGAMPDTFVTPDQRRFSPVKHPTVYVSVEQFELSSGNEAVVRLQVMHSVPVDEEKPRSSRTFVATRAFPPEGDRISAGVSALSEALDQVLRELAAWQ